MLRIIDPQKHKVLYTLEMNNTVTSYNPHVYKTLCFCGSLIRSIQAPVTLYRITFRSGLIFTTMGKIAVFTLRRCAHVMDPAFFCIAISNASKFRGEILRNSTLAPEVLAYCTGAYRIGWLHLAFPSTPLRERACSGNEIEHIPDYFSYHQQSGVIFAPRHISDYCGVM